MSVQQRLPLALLFLRLGVFIVMLMWTLDKFVKPDHAVSALDAAKAGPVGTREEG